MTDLPTEVSGRALGWLLSLTDRRIRQLADQGVLTKAGRGKYLLKESVEAYFGGKLKAETDARKAEDPLEAERVRRMRRENDEAERLLMPVEDAVAAFDTIIGSLVSDLASVPARVTEDVVVRRKIEDEINAVLAEISERCARAASDIQSGRDAAEADAPDDSDGVGAEE